MTQKEKEQLKIRFFIGGFLMLCGLMIYLFMGDDIEKDSFQAWGLQTSVPAITWLIGILYMTGIIDYIINLFIKRKK